MYSQAAGTPVLDAENMPHPAANTGVSADLAVPRTKGGRLVRPPCTLHMFPVPIPAQLFHGLGLDQIFPEKPNGGGIRYLACSLQSDITVFFQ